MSLDIYTEISEDPAASTVRVEDYIALHSRRQDTNLRIEHPSNRNPSVWNYELTEPRRVFHLLERGAVAPPCVVSHTVQAVMACKKCFLLNSFVIPLQSTYVSWKKMSPKVSLQ